MLFLSITFTNYGKILPKNFSSPYHSFFLNLVLKDHIILFKGDF
ncbi:hypothetical protein FH5_00432 [Priestia endophytica]|nr:hypothetical protein FH5_00432 [Priestia endophytica]